MHNILGWRKIHWQLLKKFSKLILSFVTKQAQCSLFQWRPCPFSNENFLCSKPILLHVHIIVVLLNMWQCLLRIVSHLSNSTHHLLKSKASRHVLFFYFLSQWKHKWYLWCTNFLWLNVGIRPWIWDVRVLSLFVNLKYIIYIAVCT